MLDVNQLSDVVMEAIMKNKELPETDESYEVISQMTEREAFDSFLIWHGIMGYTDLIMSALDSIKSAKQ